MHVVPYTKYFDRFAVPVTAEPAEISLNQWEMNAQAAIGIDDPDGTSLSVNYSDEYVDDEPWDIKEGTAKRWTFVVVKRGAETVGSVGYEFPGLIKLEDLRAWYRATFEITDPVQPEDIAADPVAAE